MLFQEFRQGLEVARIQVLTDTQTQEQYIRLDDIQEVFPDAFRFCVDGNSVSFMIAADGTKYDNPRRVPHIPGRVLDVIARAGSLSPQMSPVPSRTSSPLLGHMQYNASSGSIATAPLAAQAPLGQTFQLASPGPTPPPAVQSRSPPYSTTTTTLYSSSSYSSSSSMTLPAAATALTSSQQDLLFGGDEQQQEAQQVLYQARLYLEAVQTRLSSGNLQDLVQFQQTIHSDVSRLESLLHALQASHTRNHEAVMERFMQMLQLQQQALERLSLIQAKVEQILVQSFELVEYPIPRLFIVLPDVKKRAWDPSSLLTMRFRLYFLCECGGGEISGLHHHRHGSPSSSLSSSVAASPPRSPPHPSSISPSPSRRSLQNEAVGLHHPRSIHIAPHEGYEILRPTQFFEKYGHYILGLLHILKYGLSTASIIVPAINQLQVVDGVKQMANNFRSISNETLEGVNQSIEYLEYVLHDGSATANVMAGGHSGRGNRLTEIQALEGADLRRLESFLRVRDTDRVLGNLYRTTSPDGDGHVQWVCLDHYRWAYKEQAVKHLVGTIQANAPSTFDMHRRRASVTLKSSQAFTEFLNALTGCPVVYDLELVLDFPFSHADLSALKHALQGSNVQALSIDGCEHKGKSGAIGGAMEILASWPPGKQRFDPILRMLATNPRLQSLRTANLHQFCKRTSRSALLQPNPAGSPSSLGSVHTGLTPGIPFSWLRAFHYSHEMDEGVDQRRLAGILRACPRLKDVRLGNQYDSYVYPELWKAIAELRELEVLHLYGVTDMADDVSSVDSSSSSSETKEDEGEEDEEEDESRKGDQDSETEDEQDVGLGGTSTKISGDVRMGSLSPPASIASSTLSRPQSQRSQQSSRRQTQPKRRPQSKEIVSFVDYFAQACKKSGRRYEDSDGDIDIESISPAMAATFHQLEAEVSNGGHPPRAHLRELVLVRSGLAASDVLHWLRVLVGAKCQRSSRGSYKGAEPCQLEVLQVELVGVYPLDLQALFVEHCPQITDRLTRLWLDVATVDERNLQSLRFALRSLPLLTHLGLVLEDGGAAASSNGSSRRHSYDDGNTGEDGEEDAESVLQRNYHSLRQGKRDPGVTTSILSSIRNLPAISHLYLGRFDCRELAPFLLAATAATDDEDDDWRLQSLTLDSVQCPHEGQLIYLLQQLTSCRSFGTGENGETIFDSAGRLSHLALVNCFEPDGWVADLIGALDFTHLRTLVLNFVALGPDATAALLDRASEFLQLPSSKKHGGRSLEKLMLYGIDEMSMDIEKFLRNVRQRALSSLPASVQQQYQHQLTVKHRFISSHDMFEWMQWL